MTSTLHFPSKTEISAYLHQSPLTRTDRESLALIGEAKERYKSGEIIEAVANVFDNRTCLPEKIQIHLASIKEMPLPEFSLIAINIAVALENLAKEKAAKEKAAREQLG